jgi:hypothetical protein
MFPSPLSPAVAGLRLTTVSQSTYSGEELCVEKYCSCPRKVLELTHSSKLRHVVYFLTLSNTLCNGCSSNIMMKHFVSNGYLLEPHQLKQAHVSYLLSQAFLLSSAQSVWTCVHPFNFVGAKTCGHGICSAPLFLPESWPQYTFNPNPGGGLLRKGYWHAARSHIWLPHTTSSKKGGKPTAAEASTSH